MKIIAHRGARAELPENTTAAIGLALSLNPDGVEFDISVSSDQRAIVVHQETFTVDESRNCLIPAKADPARFWSAKYDRNYLTKLDAGSWFNPEFAGSSGGLLPDLKQVLDLQWKKTEAWIEVKDSDFFSEDLKQGEGIRALEAAIPDIEAFISKKGRAKILSFSPDVLRRAKELLPGVPRVLNIWRQQIKELPELLFVAKEIDVSVIQMAQDLILADPEIVQQVKKLKMQIYAYEKTEGDRPPEYPDPTKFNTWGELSMTGIDGFTTDYVRQLLGLLGRLVPEF